MKQTSTNIDGATRRVFYGLVRRWLAIFDGPAI